MRDATKNLKQKIQDLDIPAELHQTVFNQITGAASRKPEVIVNKLEKLIKSKKIDPREASEIARKISDSRPDLADSLEYSDDFVQRALEKWQKSPKGARIKSVKQALENTTEV